MPHFDYSKRLNDLKNRRNQTGTLLKKSMSGIATDSQYKMALSESYENINEALSVKYLLGAMQPVDEHYTRDTYAEGEKVKSALFLLNKCGFDIEFEYQGSVTNNTHIKSHSDIDILTLTKGFVTLQSPQRATQPYHGDPIADLCMLRNSCYEVLTRSFPNTVVDNNGAKSISLAGGTLQRKIDVVPSNWYDTLAYTQTGLNYRRGVMVLDYKKKQRFSNTPFYHNKLLEQKDIATHGNYKKMVRLLKTIKADANGIIKLSSYDIAALLYHMDDKKYDVEDAPLLLISNSVTFLVNIYQSVDHRNQLKVPDQSRLIFEEHRNKISDLHELIKAYLKIFEDAKNDMEYSGYSINKEITI